MTFLLVASNRRLHTVSLLYCMVALPIEPLTVDVAVETEGILSNLGSKPCLLHGATYDALYSVFDLL